MRSSTRRDRVGLWIAALATAAGLWMGLVAPSVSPVAPGPAPGPPGISAPAGVGPAP